MRLRDSVALNLTPLLLRLALAATFIWAGFGDLFAQRQYSPEEAAILADMGLIAPPLSTPPGADQPATPLPEPEPDADNSTQGESAAVSGSGSVAIGAAPALPEGYRLMLAQNDSQPDEATSESSDESAEAPAEQGAAPASTDDAPAYTAADFPEGARASGRRRISLRIHQAVHPADGGKPRLPASLGQGNTPAYLALATSLAEFIFGAFLLIGFFTRLSALALAAVMGVALWMTYLGPVILGPAGQASMLHILPHLDYADPISRLTWTTMLWRTGVLLSALALFFAGPGAFALDRWLFAPKQEPKSSDDDE